MKINKRRATVFAVAVLVVIGLFIMGRANHKNIDSLPSLEQIAAMEDEAELNSYITHFTKSELQVAWGEPSDCGTTQDVWYIDDHTKLVVNYHNNADRAVICGIVRSE